MNTTYTKKKLPVKNALVTKNLETNCLNEPHSNVIKQILAFSKSFEYKKSELLVGIEVVLN